LGLNFIKIVSEHLDRENSSAQLEYVCPFEDRLTEAANLIGGLQWDGDTPQYITPAEYPFGTGLFCSGVEITPLGNYADGGYRDAHLVVSYGALNVLDPYGSGIKICGITINVAAEMMPLPTGKYKWKDSGIELDADKDIKPTMVAPYIDLSVKVLYAAKPLLEDISFLAGRVNTGSLDITDDDSFAEGTVLFIGADLEQVVNCQGHPAWIRNCKFGVRKNDGKGWNAWFNPDSQSYEEIVSSDGDEPPYKDAYFSQLFEVQ